MAWWRRRRCSWDIPWRMAKTAAIVAQRCHDLTTCAPINARPVAQNGWIATAAIDVAAHHSGSLQCVEICETRGFCRVCSRPIRGALQHDAGRLKYLLTTLSCICRLAPHRGSCRGPNGRIGNGGSGISATNSATASRRDAGRRRRWHVCARRRRALRRRCAGSRRLPQIPLRRLSHAHRDLRGLPRRAGPCRHHARGHRLCRLRARRRGDQHQPALEGFAQADPRRPRPRRPARRQRFHRDRVRDRPRDGARRHAGGRRGRANRRTGAGRRTWHRPWRGRAHPRRAIDGDSFHRGRPGRVDRVHGDRDRRAQPAARRALARADRTHPVRPRPGQPACRAWPAARRAGPRTAAARDRRGGDRRQRRARARDPADVLRLARQRGRQPRPALRRAGRRLPGRRHPAAGPRVPPAQRLRRALPRQGRDAADARTRAGEPDRPRPARRARRGRLVPGKPDSIGLSRARRFQYPLTQANAATHRIDSRTSRGETIMKHRKNILTASILASLFLAAAAQAQDAAKQMPDADAAAGGQVLLAQNDANDSNKTKSKEAEELGTIVVSGIRESLKASLDKKRDADAIIDAITAEDIGKFPATNVAEAMAQLPGVTLDRAFSATQKVSIDGLDPSLNLSYLDGHPVAQAVWRYGDNPDRGFNYSLLPPEILGGLEIYKSPEARLPEGSLGGTIIMHTRLPLDLPSNTLDGSVGWNYNEMEGKGKPNISGFYSWKTDDKTFGFDVSAQHYEQVTSRQGEEIFGYTPVANLAANNPLVAAQVASGSIKSTDVMPNEINIAYFQQTEKRDSVTSNIQYKPNENFETTLSLMWMRDDLSNWNQSMYAFPVWLTSTVAGIDQLTSNGNGLITGGHSCDPSTQSSCAGAAGTVFDNQVRHSVVSTRGADWRASWRQDNWKLSGQVGVSTSRDPSTQAFIEPVYFGGYTWDINKGFKFDD